jgi:hypothetical protein
VVVVDSWLLFRGLVVSSGLTVYFKQVKLTWQNGYPDGENCRELLQKIAHFYHITDKQGPFVIFFFLPLKVFFFSLLARTEKSKGKELLMYLRLEYTVIPRYLTLFMLPVKRLQKEWFKAEAIFQGWPDFFVRGPNS